MKEFKMNGYLCPNSIGVQNIRDYRQMRKTIQNMTNTNLLTPLVEIVIRVHDPRQEWIDKWYAFAREDERRKTITIKHCKDATFIMGMAQCAFAAPRHGDKYDQHTGIAVAYAKLCGEEIPNYI